MVEIQGSIWTNFHFFPCHNTLFQITPAPLLFAKVKPQQRFHSPKFITGHIKLHFRINNKSKQNHH